MTKQKKETTRSGKDNSKPTVEVTGDLSNVLDFKDIKGNVFVKRALEIAAAGLHHILLTGPQGCGKTALHSGKGNEMSLKILTIDETGKGMWPFPVFLFFRNRIRITYPYLQNPFEGVVNFRKSSPVGWGSLGRSPYTPGSFSPIQIIESKNIGVKFASFMGELRRGRNFVKTDKRPGKIHRKCVGFEEFSNRHLYLYSVLFPFKLFPTLTHLSFCEGPQITRIDTDQKNKKNRVICGHFFLSSPGVGGNTFHALCSVLFLSIGKPNKGKWK